MSLNDLETEMWQAVRAVRQPHIDRLLALGVPGVSLARLGCIQPPFGVTRVTWLPGGIYEPSGDGVPSVIVPVFDIDEFGATGPVDLIAWCTEEPERWSWRVGQAWALGDHLLDDDLPVPVVATPLEWLKAGGEALCILDWEAPPHFWASVRAGPPLQFSDDALRQCVRNALVATAPMPIMEMSNVA